MKTLTTKIKILLGLKKAICTECRHYKYQPDLQPVRMYEGLDHKCQRYKKVKTNFITGKKKELRSYCVAFNNDGRCLGYEEAKKQWNE